LKLRVQADLLAFFEKHLLPVVLLQNYVVDLLWRPEADRTFEAYVIELNPMAEFAGSGLFKCITALSCFARAPLIPLLQVGGA
jgi:hypothetical protein